MRPRQLPERLRRVRHHGSSSSSKGIKREDRWDRRRGRGKRVENCSWFCQQDVSRIREFRRTGVCPGPDRTRERERERRREEERSPFPSRHPTAISGYPDVLSIPNEYFCSRKFRREPNRGLPAIKPPSPSYSSIFLSLSLFLLAWEVNLGSIHPRVDRLIVTSRIWGRARNLPQCGIAGLLNFLRGGDKWWREGFCDMRIRKLEFRICDFD